MKGSFTGFICQSLICSLAFSSVAEIEKKKIEPELQGSSCGISVLFESFLLRKEGWLRSQKELYKVFSEEIDSKNKGKKKEDQEEKSSFNEYLKWDLLFSGYTQEFEYRARRSRGYLELLKKVDAELPKEGTILDLGCGIGLCARACSTHERQFVMVERNSTILKKARQNVPAAVALNGNFAVEGSLFKHGRLTGAVLLNVVHLLTDAEFDFVFSNLAQNMSKNGQKWAKLVLTVPDPEAFVGIEGYYPRTAADITQRVTKHKFIFQKNEVVSDGTRFLTFIY